ALSFYFIRPPPPPSKQSRPRGRLCSTDVTCRAPAAHRAAPGWRHDTTICEPPATGTEPFDRRAMRRQLSVTQFDVKEQMPMSMPSFRAPYVVAAGYAFASLVAAREAARWRSASTRPLRDCRNPGGLRRGLATLDGSRSRSARRVARDDGAVPCRYSCQRAVEGSRPQ